MCELMIKFFVYSVLGWVCESVWHILLHGKPEQRRQLVTLPLCPVYGAAAILLCTLIDPGQGLVTLWAAGALVASAAELLWYLLFVKIFGVRLWNYSHARANLFGGVCGAYTLLWGVMAAVFVRVVDPTVSGIITKMPDMMRLFAAVFLWIITAADMRKTAAVLADFRDGEIDGLPDCFPYMEKIL